VCGDARLPRDLHHLLFGSDARADDLSNLLYVPMDSASREWEDHLDDYRVFYLQKNAYGDPKVNSARRAFDMFQDNGNAVRLVELLAVDQWLAFGNAFDGCVNCAARGLLAAGQKVCLLPDVGVLGAKGYGPSGTEENLRRVIAELIQLGADTSTLPEFLSSLDS
jgi:hypothetical protein